MYDQAVVVHNLARNDLISGVDLAVLRPQMTLAPADAERVSYPKRRGDSSAGASSRQADVAMTESSSSSSSSEAARQGSGKVFWCFSQMGLLHFIHWYMCRTAHLQQQGTFSATRCLRMLDDLQELETDTETPNVLRTCIRALNHGRDTVLDDYYLRYTYLAQRFLAGGWPWPTRLSNMLVPDNQKPRLAPLKMLEARADVELSSRGGGTGAAAADGKAPSSVSGAAASASAVSVQSPASVSSHDATDPVYERMSALYIQSWRQLWAKRQVNPPPRLPPVIGDDVKTRPYSARERKAGLPYFTNPASVTWRGRRAWVQEQKVGRGDMTMDELKTGEYSESAFMRRAVQGMVGREKNPMYQKIRRFIVNGLQSQSPDQKLRVLLLRGGPGQGKSFLVDQYANRRTQTDSPARYARCAIDAASR